MHCKACRDGVDHPLVKTPVGTRLEQQKNRVPIVFNKIHIMDSTAPPDMGTHMQDATCKLTRHRKMYSQSVQYCWALTTLILLSSASCTATAAGKVPAIIVFGDSTVDSGNNNYIPTMARGNFPPYGRDFEGGVATGRFSNGRLVTDFLSEALGLASSVPAYLDGSYTIDQLATGVNFASGGTGMDALTAKIASVIPLSQQLEYFKEYKERLKLAKGDAVADKIIAGALYVFSIGTNDFMVNYFTMPIRRAEYTPEEYVAYLVGLAEACVREVYELGARKIMFNGIPPFGCVPAMRTMNHDAPGECNEEYNRVALRYNAEVQAALSRLGGELGAGAQVVYSDVYDVPYDILSNPSGYGFENVAQGCCGTGLIETSVLCGMDAAFTCQDADKYVFFDSVHPSEQTYRILADNIIRSTLQVFLWHSV
uniref:Uncharacterized protein n=1 Tax=Avena sativa TaxID=4498 RepID=A0ACD5YB62_AVESA